MVSIVDPASRYPASRSRLDAPYREPKIRYLSTVTVAPITSTIRGVPSEVVLDEKDGIKKRCVVNLHNAVTVSQQRLGFRLSHLSARRMDEICAALRFSIGCDGEGS